MIAGHIGTFGGRWYAWVRVLGYGLALSNAPPLFSERYGHRKVVRLFGIKVEFLRPRG